MDGSIDFLIALDLLIVYKKTDKWGSLKEFDESLIVARVVSDFIELPFSVETFEISFDNISNNGSTLNLIWDNMLAIYYIDALTKDKMVNNIKNTLSKNPKPSDYQSELKNSLSYNCTSSSTIK